MRPQPDLRTAVAPPSPDPDATPDGFVVLADSGDRIHFLDWGGPTPANPGADGGRSGILLVHGISATAWVWAPVARRLRTVRRTIATDLRGHGLSDAPTMGYDPPSLASDLTAVADGAGLLAGDGVVLVGHGFGACVAAWAGARLGDACRGLVLVDGGWEDLRETSGMEPDEFLRTLDEPPEVLRSLAAFLADRRGFDPATWDSDQERAARASVVETHAGRVVPVTRPHVVEAVVHAMFSYRPVDTLRAVRAPIAILSGADDDAGTRTAALGRTLEGLAAAGHPDPAVLPFPGLGHNLMRYRPAELTAAILAVAGDGPAATALGDRD
jgi:pimeloyl-ACP methyl ester carboxylesterase